MLSDGDKHPSIYLSHITINGIDETLAWSGPDKARQYVEDRVPGNIEWKTNLSDNVQAVVKDDEIIARVECVKIADPASLASMIEKYPSPRQIIDPELIDDSG